MTTRAHFSKTDKLITHSPLFPCYDDNISIITFHLSTILSARKLKRSVLLSLFLKNCAIHASGGRFPLSVTLRLAPWLHFDLVSDFICVLSFRYTIISCSKMADFRPSYHPSSKCQLDHLHIHNSTCMFMCLVNGYGGEYAAGLEDNSLPDWNSCKTPG